MQRVSEVFVGRTRVGHDYQRSLNKPTRKRLVLGHAARKQNSDHLRFVSGHDFSRAEPERIKDRGFSPCRSGIPEG
jgi:hypothetical protein